MGGLLSSFLRSVNGSRISAAARSRRRHPTAAAPDVGPVPRGAVSWASPDDSRNPDSQSLCFVAVRPRNVLPAVRLHRLQGVEQTGRPARGGFPVPWPHLHAFPVHADRPRWTRCSVARDGRAEWWAGQREPAGSVHCLWITLWTSCAARAERCGPTVGSAVDDYGCCPPTRVLTCS